MAVQRCKHDIIEAYCSTCRSLRQPQSIARRPAPPVKRVEPAEVDDGYGDLDDDDLDDDEPIVVSVEDDDEPVEVGESVSVGEVDIDVAADEAAATRVERRERSRVAATDGRASRTAAFASTPEVGRTLSTAEVERRLAGLTDRDITRILEDRKKELPPRLTETELRQKLEFERQPETMMLDLPVNRINPFPEQPRKRVKPATVRSITISFTIIGQLKPAQVRWLPDDPFYFAQLIDGENRWSAAFFAGMETLRVIVTHVESIEQQYVYSAVANFGGDPHTHAETAAMVYRMITAGGLKQTEVAQILGKAQSWVSGYARMENLDPQLWERMDNPDLSEEMQLSYSVAKGLCSYPAEFQLRVEKEVRERGFANVNSALAYIRRRAREESIGRTVERNPNKDYRMVGNSVGVMLTRGSAQSDGY